MNEFKLDGSEFIELKNLLKVTGLCENGGQAKDAVSTGQVSVDGKPESRKSAKIKSGQSVTYKGKTIKVVD